MIISHRYRFIFIKTLKTGGTSVEIALSRFCGKDDIITPITFEDEKLRAQLGYPGPRGYAKPLREYTSRDWARLLIRRKPPAHKFWNHIPAVEIRRRISTDVWESYFKFSIDRNPWDKAISLYFFDKSRKGLDLSFHDWLLSVNQASLSNFDRYSIDNNVVADYIVRYEALSEDLAEVARRLRLPDKISVRGIRAKAGYREDRRPYREFLNERERSVVERACHREIKAFGYQF